MEVLGRELEDHIGFDFRFLMCICPGFSSLTQCEQLKACHGAGVGSSPVTPNSGESQEVDILQMLTKAKDEYTKVSPELPYASPYHSERVVTGKDLRRFRSQPGEVKMAGSRRFAF